MRLISHRGNQNGPCPEKENRIDYIRAAMWAGYEVEIDIRGKDGKLYLGHDDFQEEVDHLFLANKNFWVHAKNMEAVKLLIDWRSKINWFWHQEDDITLTSMNFVWTYPGKRLVEGAIAVMPELIKDWDITLAGGICSDFIQQYQNHENSIF